MPWSRTLDGPWVPKLAFETIRQDLPANWPRKSVITWHDSRAEDPPIERNQIEGR